MIAQLAQLVHVRQLAQLLHPSQTAQIAKIAYFNIERIAEIIPEKY